MALPLESELFNPFPGLRSFEPDEEHLFFGRERQIDELLTRLRLTRFLTVVGTSGSGKSSVVRSGLIPSLYAGYMAKVGSAWRIALMRPGEDPIGKLATALNDPAVLGSEGAPPEMQRAILDSTLRRGGRGLVEAVKQARLPEAESLLIVVDQFEELFRFKESRRRAAVDEAAAFVKLLLEAAEETAVPVYVVLTMRSDFLGNCTEFDQLPEAINEGLYLIPRMTREQRRAAIEGPVAVGGGEITPRLVQRLLNDVGDDPDQLPIMQHALMRTWDYWEHNRTGDEPLDLRHYEAIGTMKEALSLHAEEAYRELGSEEARRCAERLFKNLTDKGSDGRGTRRPILIEDFCAAAGVELELVTEVVESFRRPGRSFLVPPAGVPLTPDTILDISHESLMRVWTRLREWVDDEAQSARLYIRLARAAELYQDGAGGLWRDPELQLALSWKEASRPTATWASRYDPSFERAMTFLKVSRQERDREIERKERQRKAQLARTRIFAVIVAVGAFVILLAGIYAYFQKEKAEELREGAIVAQKQAEEARDEAAANAAEAIAQREAARRSESRALEAEDEAVLESERAREQAERARRAERRAVAEAERARDAEQSALEAKIAAESAREEANDALDEAQMARDDAETNRQEALRLRWVELARNLGSQVPRIDRERGSEVAALVALHAFRLNERLGGPDEAAEIYEGLRFVREQLQGEPPPLAEFDEGVRALALDGGASRLFAGGEDGTVRVIDLASGDGARTIARLPAAASADAEPSPADRPHGEVRTLSVAPGDHTLAVGDAAGRIHTLAFDGTAVAAPWAAHAGAIRALAHSPAGELASAGRDGAVRLWSAPGKAATELVRPGEPAATALAFDSAGERLAAGFEDGRVLLYARSATGWRAVDSAQMRESAAVTSLDFDPASERLAAGYRDGTINLWQLARDEMPIKLPGHVSSVNSLDFDAGGEILASASSDKTVRLWRARAPTQSPIELRGHTSWIWDSTITGDGEQVFSVAADATVRRWEAQTHDLAARVCDGVHRELDRVERDLFFPEKVPTESMLVFCAGLTAPRQGSSR